MAIIKPFKGVLYDKKRLSGMDGVMAPPYDVISPSMQDELYGKDDHNIVRVILGREQKGDAPGSDKYARAAGFLESWLKDGVLRHDAKPSLYVYCQEFHALGTDRKRYGFIGLMKIEGGRKRKVMPHEQTFSGPKEDRLRLLRATGANTSPIFSIFSDEKDEVTGMLREAASGDPYIDISFDGVVHKLWRLDDAAMIASISGAMKHKPVFIADGHHRYETAVNYSEEAKKKGGPAGADHVMMYFTSTNDPGLTVLSTYRVLRDIGGVTPPALRELLARHFETVKAPDMAAMFRLTAEDRKRYAFGLYLGKGDFYAMHLKDPSVRAEAMAGKMSQAWKELDVALLHRLVFGHIMGLGEDKQGHDNMIYTRDEDEARGLVDSGECMAAFFPRPTRVADVQAVAGRGERMPHKSTYFYPKLLTGLVINKFGAD